MKHVKLFESWHNSTTCPQCKGTGLIELSSKKQSVEELIKNILSNTKNAKEFMEYLGDDEFREHAIDILKERGVYNLDMARMVAALKMNQEDLQKVIGETIEGYEVMEDLIEDKHINHNDRLGIKKVLALKAEVLDILRK